MTVDQRGAGSHAAPAKDRHRVALNVVAYFRSRPELLVALAPGLLALAIGIYQLSLPGVLFGVHGYSNGIGYDDGVYMGASLRLVHGVIPYRDFVLLHPPGVPLLLAPISALGNVVGTHEAFGLARVLTIAVVALNASLAAFAVRYRGITAMLTAGTALACFPLAVAADQTVYLEPYVVFFCLLGAVLMFQSGRIAGSRRLWFAGLSLGFAAACKVWAIIPIAVALAFCLPAWRNRVRPLAVGVVVGVAVPCLPFFAIAPGNFVHQVVSDQLSRVAPGASLPASERLLMLTGLSGLTWIHAHTWMALLVGIVLVAFVVLAYLLPTRTKIPADWFILALAVLSTVEMFITQSFSDHYAYFPAAFIAMVVGIAVARLIEAFKVFEAPRLKRVAGLGVPLCLVVLAASLLVPQQLSYAGTYLSQSEDPSLILDSLIPPGSCVLADEVSYTIAANRFNSGGAGCPEVIDGFGVWIADGLGAPPYEGPVPPQFVAMWGQALSKADYVVLVVTYYYDDYFPWTAQLTSWFGSNFKLLYSQTGLYVYQHVKHTPPPGSASSTTANQEVSAGLAAERSGNTSLAFSDFEAAAAADPNNLYAHYDLGYIYQQRGDSTDALTQYRRALSIDPKFDDALYNLGVLEAPTNPAGAIQYYKQDLNVNPKNAAANFNLGILLIKQGQASEGDSYVETGLSLNPALSADIPPGITVPSH